MKKIYVVVLSDEEQQELQTLVRRGSERVRRINRAPILLMAHDGKPDRAIAALFPHRWFIRIPRSL